MSHTNSTRSGCKDVFNAFMVKTANYEGGLEMPRIKREEIIPNKLISFSKAVNGKDYNAWVHFFQDDFAFERIWRNPKKYLNILKKYNGVITPDFSLYRDMPLVMQAWNVYRSRAVGHWLQNNGVSVITNVRWGDERSFEFFCDGVPKEATIAIGTHGCIKNVVDRYFLVKAIDTIVEKLKPKVLVIYGSAPSYIFDKYKKQGIRIVQFDSEIKARHSEEVSA